MAILWFKVFKRISWAKPTLQEGRLKPVYFLVFFAFFLFGFFVFFVVF